MLTVQGIIDELGLELTAGKEAAESPIRWVHISELLDPTPWMSGGELLLTTGIQLHEEEEQRSFVRMLVDHHLAGLGFGTGIEHEHIPPAVVEEAERLGFPLFEVPYEMPFIAITEKAFARLVNDQYEVLQRGIAVHRRLEQLVLEQRGLQEVTRALSAAIGGTVVMLDWQGEQMASANFRRKLDPGTLDAIRLETAQRNAAGRPVSFEPSHDDVAGRALALPVSAEPQGGPRAWIVAIRDTGGLGEFERLILQQAVTIVALELMRRRVVRDTERRLAGDILAEVIAGELDENELRGRLRPFGVGARAAVIVFALPDPEAAEAALEAALVEEGTPALVASREGLLCAVVDGSGGDQLELAAKAREALAREHDTVRAAASRPAPVEQLKRAFFEARYALDATKLLDGRAPDVSSWRDLGALQFLLSVQEDEALRLFRESVLGPIENGEGDYGGELLRSLEAFVEHNGQWERAARELFCHRHTLRYRIRRVEQLTGRDLSSARDRIEFWLALKARELVG
ncbi:MAG TPA: PucR family transcriptional regulator ligand-binding domain-containing protein [Solirubrobacterales bacterium]|nr:PucR family transcriptional regulator ligand-binding domain-containing protein [Solirubrobacterales bacterium]